MRFLPPEHEYDAFSVARDRADHMLGEVLPAFLLMRIGLTFAYGEDSVE